MTIGWFEVLIRLVIASVAGSFIGYQREVADRPAGLRTHTLVALGACLMTIISIYPFLKIEGADPSRIAAQIVVGIGFLGAGTIIRQGSIVRGLTTAATLWIVAGIGLAIGAGAYLAGILTAILVLIILIGLKQFELRIIGLHEFHTLHIKCPDDSTLVSRLSSVLTDLGVNIKKIEIDHDELREEMNIKSILDVPSSVKQNDIIEDVLRLENIIECYFEGKSRSAFDSGIFKGREEDKETEQE